MVSMKKVLIIFLMSASAIAAAAQTKINPAKLIQGSSGGGSLFLKTDNTGNLSFSNNLNGNVLGGIGNAVVSSDALPLGQAQGLFLGIGNTAANANLLRGKDTTQVALRDAVNVFLEKITLNKGIAAPGLVISMTPDYILNISAANEISKVHTKNLKISLTASDVLTANNATSMNFDFDSQLMYTIPFDFSNAGADVNTTITATNFREGGDYTLWYKGSLFKTFTFSSTYFKNANGTAVAQCAMCAARIYNFKIIGGIAYLIN